MKRITAVVVCLALLLAGCAQTKTICGVTYDSYGLVNASEKQNTNIRYEVVWGNVFWAVVLSETVIAPIYFFGWSLFQPVGVASDVKGAVDQPRSCVEK